MTKSKLAVLAFTLLYVGVFAWYYLSVQNYEFLWYIATLIVFVIIIAGTLHLSRFPDWILWLLSFWGLLHMAGGGVPIDGSVLYAYVVYPFVTDGELLILKFDQIVHMFGFGVSAVVLHYLLRPKLSVSPFWLGTVAVLGAMGLGCLNEIIEFAAVVALSETGVGGYYNIALDLVFNTIGAIVAVLLVSLKRVDNSTLARTY